MAMAVIVKNTFLDVAEHKFLNFDEPICDERRCHSVPPTWKPVNLMPSRSFRSKKRTPSIASSASTQSDISFRSTVDSFESLSSSGDISVKSTSEMENIAFNFSCGTPGNSQGSPGELAESSADHGYFCDLDAVNADEVAQSVSDIATEESEDNDGMTMNMSNAPNHSMEIKHDACSSVTQTRLKSESPAFQPVSSETRFDVVTNAVYLALIACGQTSGIKIEKGVQGVAATTIGAELKSGLCLSSRCYDAIHLARNAVGEITERLHTVTLLSSRVQKEELGYSLRSSIACIPCGAEDNMCWDVFRKGYCPRRSECRWYHPQDADIARLKVNIRYTEAEKGVSSEVQLPTSLPAVRHKISLGELI